MQPISRWNVSFDVEAAGRRRIRTLYFDLSKHVARWVGGWSCEIVVQVYMYLKYFYSRQWWSHVKLLYILQLTPVKKVI